MGDALAPVVGRGTVRRMPVSNGPVVFRPSDPDSAAPEPDEEAIDRFVRASARWLDAHLTDLQDGGSGLLEQVAMDGLLNEVNPEALLAVTTDLASADRPVEEATYDVLVAVDGAPQWLRVTVETTDPEGDSAQAQFIFVPDGDWTALVAAGPIPQPGSEDGGGSEDGEDDPSRDRDAREGDAAPQEGGG